MKDLAFRLLRWKVVLVAILTRSLVRFSLRGWENVLFELGRGRVTFTAVAIQHCSMVFFLLTADWHSRFASCAVSHIKCSYFQSCSWIPAKCVRAHATVCETTVSHASTHSLSVANTVVLGSVPGHVEKSVHEWESSAIKSISDKAKFVDDLLIFIVVIPHFLVGCALVPTPAWSLIVWWIIRF